MAGIHPLQLRQIQGSGVTDEAPAKRTDAEKIEALNALVIQGSSLRSAIKEVFKDARKFHEAITKDSRLRSNYAAAMEVRADLLADEIVEISDSDTDPQRARNRIGARTWLAAKLKPKTYSERIDLNVNQSISINDALTDARSRILPLFPEPELIQDAEVIEPPALQVSGPAFDSETRFPDIFS